MTVLLCLFESPNHQTTPKMQTILLHICALYSMTAAFGMFFALKSLQYWGDMRLWEKSFTAFIIVSWSASTGYVAYRIAQFLA